MSGATEGSGDNSATVRVTLVSPDGRRRTVDMSEAEYRQYVRQQRFSSPFESLFGGRGGLFDAFFDEDERGGASGVAGHGGRGGNGARRIPISTRGGSGRAAAV